MPLALPLLGMTLGAPLRLLALLFGMLRGLRLDRRGLGRRVSRGPLAARSLLWTRLLSRSVGLRLDPLRLRSPSAVRLGTLDGGTGSATHRPPARRVINAAQAAVVQRMFELSAAGWGITRIAKQLNDEGVPPPRGGRQGWAPTAIREMLHNELYRGRLIWNRTKKGHRRGTKTQDNRPPEELVVVELPECRIVSNELWEAAHAALERRAQVFVPQARAAVEGEPLPALTAPSPYLLSRLARCAWCGGPMIAMSRHHGRRRGYFYGCANNWKRGPAICRNTVRIPQEALDRAVVGAMANALDADPPVEAAVEQALARLAETPQGEADRRPTLQRQIAEARRREQRLADAIAQGTSGDAPPEALITALRAEEVRRKGLEQELATQPQPPAVISLDRARVARELRTRAHDVRGLLLRQPAQAREALQALLVDRVECTPVLVVGARGYAFTGDGTFGGLLAASTWPTTYGGLNGPPSPVAGLLTFTLVGEAHAA